MLGALLIGAFNGTLLASIGWELARQHRDRTAQPCICQHIPEGHRLKVEAT